MDLLPAYNINVTSHYERQIEISNEIYDKKQNEIINRLRKIPNQNYDILEKLELSNKNIRKKILKEFAQNIQVDILYCDKYIRSCELDWEDAKISGSNKVYKAWQDSIEYANIHKDSNIEFNLTSIAMKNIAVNNIYNAKAEKHKDFRKNKENYILVSLNPFGNSIESIRENVRVVIASLLADIQKRSMVIVSSNKPLDSNNLDSKTLQNTKDALETISYIHDITIIEILFFMDFLDRINKLDSL